MSDYVQRAFDALERGRRFVTHDIWYVGRPGEEIPEGFIIKQIRVAILLLRNLIEDALLLRAAALTFTTTLSLVPVLAIVFWAIQEFNLGEELSAFVNRWASPIVATDTAPDSANDELKRTLITWIFPNLAQEAREVGVEAADPVQYLVDTAGRIAGETSAKGIGLFGFAFILASVFGLMRNIESAFNSIWGLKPSRSWFRIVSDYIMIILFLPILVALVLTVTVNFTDGPVADRLGPFAYLLRGVQYVVIWFAFSVLYAVVPNTRVRWRYAILGGFVAGTLWCLASKGYVEFQIGLSRNLIYSTFALVPLLLIWIYLSWIILLFGAELTFAYQNEKTFALERLAADASYAYREAVGLRAMIEIAHRFDAGVDGLSIEESAHEWNVPTRLLHETLDQLEEANLVRKSDGQTPRYLPARSIDKIAVRQVVGALRESGREPSALRQDETLRPLLEEINAIRSPAMRSNLSDSVLQFFPRQPALEASSTSSAPSFDAASEATLSSDDSSDTADSSAEQHEPSSPDDNSEPTNP